MLWHPSTLSNRRNYVHFYDCRTLLCGYVHRAAQSLAELLRCPQGKLPVAPAGLAVC